MSTDRPSPGDGLLHPAAWIAVAVLVLNDHWAKYALPGAVTGKVSDVAGLVFFPLLLQGALELLGAPISRRTLWACAAATGIVFAAIQVWDPAADAYRTGLGVVQWPFRAVLGLVRDGRAPELARVAHTADRSDLLALPGLGVAVWAGWRRTHPDGGVTVGAGPPGVPPHE